LSRRPVGAKLAGVIETRSASEMSTTAVTRTVALEHVVVGSEIVDRIHCIVVDDHPAIRLGLSELLAAEPDFEVVDTFATAEAAYASARNTAIDAAVVDYQLGGRSGLWCSRRLKALARPPAVVIYSAFSDHLLAAASVVARADALVSKAALGSELCDRIRDAAGGRARLPIVPPAVADSLRHRLDPTEQAIYAMMSARTADPEIAATLGLTAEDLEARSWTMLRKLIRTDAGRP
jgi:DNA-binding NarL/FixJ family response regulator